MGRLCLATGSPGNPFLSHRFLKALEDSRSVGPRTGWKPRHLVAEAGGGTLQGAAPLYMKSHSQGEYIFDHGWAQAFERAGGRYYPKLQVAVPFTPVPGPRLFARPGRTRSHRPARRPDREAALRLAAESRLSSLHVTFCTEADRPRAAARRWKAAAPGQAAVPLAQRRLPASTSSWRPRHAQAQGDPQGARASGAKGYHPTLTGAEIKPEHWDAFFKFYMDTGSRKWGSPYLNRAFFAGWHDHGRQGVLMLAMDGRAVAGALNLIGSDTLYGRYWGCLTIDAFLHFEVCYYQAIDFAIARGLAAVEAGAQGEHKLERGYLPVPTFRCIGSPTRVSPRHRRLPGTRTDAIDRTSRG